MVHYWVRRLDPREFFFFFFLVKPELFLLSFFVCPFFLAQSSEQLPPVAPVCPLWCVFMCGNITDPRLDSSQETSIFSLFFFDLIGWLKHYSIVALSSKGTDKKWFEKRKKSNSLGHNVQPEAFIQKWKMSIVLPSIILPISLAHNTSLWLMDINSACSTVNRIMINITFISGLLHLVWPWVL